MPNRKPTAAGVYLRISQDRDGESLGVERQRVDCMALAASRGWAVADEYVDNDRSAYSGKPRPAYARLLDDIAAGRIDGVIAWHTDRLHRRFRDLEPFVAAVEDAGVPVATVKAGELDVATASGRMVARLLAAADAHEVERKSERQRAKATELARAGQPAGGGMRPFGYEPDGMTIRDAEAGLLREAAERAIAGESVFSIAADWRARDIRTSTGRPWTFRQLKRTLGGPRLAGLRRHGDDVYPAAWPAVFDLATWDALQDVLSDRSRGGAGPGRHTPYLLTGLLFCGRCGRRMNHHPNHGKRSYACLRDAGGCGSLRIIAEPTEDVIREAVFARTDAGLLDAALSDVRDDDLADRLAGDRAALDGLVRDHYVERIIDRDAFLAARDELRVRITEAERRLAARIDPGLTGGQSVRAAWKRNDAAWRRRFLAALIERVTIGPMPKGRPFGFTPDRIDVRWRT